MITQKEKQWIVKDKLALGEAKLISGHCVVNSKIHPVCKLIKAIANGRQYTGRDVLDCHVMLIDGENNEHSLDCRWERIISNSKELDHAVSIFDVRPHRPLKTRHIEQIICEAQAEITKPLLVVIESIGSVFYADENNAEEVKDLMDSLREIAEAKDVTILLHRIRTDKRPNNPETEEHRLKREARNAKGHYACGDIIFYGSKPPVLAKPEDRPLLKIKELSL